MTKHLNIRITPIGRARRAASARNKGQEPHTQIRRMGHPHKVIVKVGQVSPSKPLSELVA